MAEFRQGVITTRGLDLLARAQGGTANITFTRAMIGNGVWASDTPEETIMAATALRNARAEFPVIRAAFVDNATSLLTIIANNSNNQSGYDITEVGVYATDGTTEVLYAVYLATSTDWFPAYNSLTPYSITYDCYITVANAIDVTVATHTMELDDSAGAGDTDKVWSADKITDELALKADKTDTVLLTTLSRGRFDGPRVGDASFAFGNVVEASGDYSHAEGSYTNAKGEASHAEGEDAIASGDFSHAEGYGTRASGEASHAEGQGGIASGINSHAEGYAAEAYGDKSHAEGASNAAIGEASHAEGVSSLARGLASHAEGFDTEATGDASHAEGFRTVANHQSQHVFGKYNTEDPSSAESNDPGNYVEIVGNGTGYNAKSNARALDWNGNEYIAGDVYVNCSSDSSGGMALGARMSVLALKGSTTEVTGNTTATVSLTGLTANHIICDWGLSLGDVGNPPADIEIVPGAGVYTITITNYGGTAFTITPVFVLPQ